MQANETLSINQILQSTEEMVDNKNRDVAKIEKERDSALGQIASLQLELEQKEDSIRQVLEHQKLQVQKWAEECAGLKAELEQRESDIVDLENELRKLRESGRERALQAEIDKRDAIVHGKNQEIRLLEEDIETKELELLQWAKNYKAFEEEAAAKMTKALEEQYEHYKEMEAEAQRKIRDNEKLTELADEAVIQNHELEKEMIELKSRMDQYERGTWGLFEAIQEIKQLKERARKQDFVEQEARKKITNEKEKVAKMYQENQFLRQKAGIPDDQLIDHTQLNVEVHRKQQRLLAKNEQLLREIERLEDERLDLKDQLLHEAEGRADVGVMKGLNVHCQRILHDFAVKLRDEGEEAVPLNNMSLELKARVRELETENDRLVLQLHERRLNLQHDPKTVLPGVQQVPPEPSGEGSNDKTEAYFQELVSILKAAGTPGVGDSAGISHEAEEQLKRKEQEIQKLQKQLDSLRPESLQATLVINANIPEHDDEYASVIEHNVGTALGAEEDQVSVGFVERGAEGGCVVHLILKGPLCGEQGKQAEELLMQLEQMIEGSMDELHIQGLNRDRSLDRLRQGAGHQASDTGPTTSPTIHGLPQAAAMPKIHAHLMEALQLLGEREKELEMLQVNYHFCSSCDLMLSQAEMEIYHSKFQKMNDEHVQNVRAHLAAKARWSRELQVCTCTRICGHSDLVPGKSGV